MEKISDVTTYIDEGVERIKITLNYGILSYSTISQFESIFVPLRLKSQNDDYNLNIGDVIVFKNSDETYVENNNVNIPNHTIFQKTNMIC